MRIVYISLFFMETNSFIFDYWLFPFTLVRDGWKNDLSIEAKQIKACQLSSVGYNIIFWSDTNASINNTEFFRTYRTSYDS